MVPVEVLGGVLDVEEEVPEEVGEGRRGSRRAMAPRASLRDWAVEFGFRFWVTSGVESGLRFGFLVTLWPWLQPFGFRVTLWPWLLWPGLLPLSEFP